MTSKHIDIVTLHALGEGIAAVAFEESDDEPGLEDLQSRVEGYIERIDVTFHGKRFDGWINEEGKLKEMEPNIVATALWLNQVLKHNGKPTWDCITENPLPYITEAWKIMGRKDYIAGPLVVCSSEFKELLQKERDDAEKTSAH